MFARVSMARQLSMLTTLCPMRNVSEPSEGLPPEVVSAPSPVPEGLMWRQPGARIAAPGADFRIGGDRAFYSPNYDFIQVPRPEAGADIFDALIATLRDPRLEPDLEDLLWSAVNLFH